MDGPTLTAIGTVALGTIVWAVRQEGRINTLDKLREEDKEDRVRLEKKVDQILLLVRNGRGYHSTE